MKINPKYLKHIGSSLTADGKSAVSMKDLLFTMLLSVVCAGLLFLPSPGGNSEGGVSERVKARVLSTEDGLIKQYGIVKEGSQSVEIEILSGTFKGKIVTGTNLITGKMEFDKIFKPGDTALAVLNLDDAGTSIGYVNVVDHYRLDLEMFLFLLFTLFLILFAGWTGFKSILSFVFSGILIWKVMIPAYLDNWNPVFIAIVIVTILTAAIIFLVGGLTKKGTVAFFGAMTGILLTCILSIVFGNAFRINGAVIPFGETLLYSGRPYLNLTEIFFAGIFLSASGAVMDLAMDISASMEEVSRKHPEISRSELVLSGFRVGRVVIGTQTTTLLLAYSGGYTAMLMVFASQGTPMVNVFNLSYISAEILHTLVGSFGLVTVAPFTALIGGMLYAKRIAHTEPLRTVPDDGTVRRLPS